MEQNLLIPPPMRKLIDIHTARFYAAELEKRNDDLITRNRTAISRGYTLLGLCVTLATACMACINLSGNLLLPAWVGLATCVVVAAVLMAKVTTVHGHWGAGSSATELDMQTFIPYYAEQLRMTPIQVQINLVCDKLDLIQQDIEQNNRVLTDILYWYHKCLRALMLGLLVTLLTAAW